MMLVGLFLLIYFSRHVFGKEPDVNCLVVDQDYVRCTWNGQGTPEVNYTFLSRFHCDNMTIECTSYILENSTIIGCQQPYEDLLKTRRFRTFYTTLVHGNNSFLQEHGNLKTKVKLYPPTNLSVKNGTDSNLWFYWNQSYSQCAESEVRYRTNYNKWEISRLGLRKKNYCINLPSSTSRYELQVRSTVGQACGESEFWSSWSQPVFWGSMRVKNSTDTSRLNGSSSMSVWTPVLYLVGAFTLILLVMMLVHHERIRIILIPIVPNPAKKLDGILIHGNLEEWLPISKDLKEGFNANFNEHACPVREYSRVPQSVSESSESSESSTSSVATDQTDCSNSIPMNESECSATSCSSSSSSLPVSSEGEQATV